MKLFNLFRVGLMLSSGLLLAACSQPLPRAHPMPAKDVPQKNPQPKYFLTVKGHIAPSLIGKVKVVWFVTYHTSNMHCWRVVNQFEGAAFPRSKTLTIVSHPNAAGDFQNQLPLDYFLPGNCRWRLESASYTIGDLDSMTLAFFYKPYKDLKHEAVQHFICNHAAQCMAEGGTFFSEGMDLPIKNHYVFQALIKKGKYHD